jgi:phage protein D
VQNSQLGSQTSIAGTSDLGSDETFTVDHPIWDKEEATALAKARLQTAALSFITGEAEVTGDPKFKLGKLVKIVANAKGSGDPFNGKYYIMGVTHRHNASHAKDDSAYVTILRLARDAQAQ